MPPRIIVADPDQGFGLMLAQMLETNREYVADYVSSGSQALALARDKHPQLVIIDAALGDMTPPALIRALRQISPGLRIMVIPLTNTLPREYAELDLQGTLPKPFFAGDLGTCIAQALGVEVAPPDAFPAQPPVILGNPQTSQVGSEAVVSLPGAPDIAGHSAPVAVPRVRRATPSTRAGTQSPPDRALPVTTLDDSCPSAIERALTTLSKEISADALFVVKQGIIIAHRTTLNDLRQESLSDLLAGWFKVASGLASFVGERGGRFKQLHFEGDRYHIYGFGIAEAIVLVVICRTDIPFGHLRLSVKSASAEIAQSLR